VTWPAIGQENPEASKVSIGVIELDPAHREFQKLSAESAIEHSGPSPVMTTGLFVGEVVGGLMGGGMGDYIWIERSGCFCG